MFFSWFFENPEMSSLTFRDFFRYSGLSSRFRESRKKKRVVPHKKQFPPSQLFSLINQKGSSKKTKSVLLRSLNWKNWKITRSSVLMIS
jgi:hypothetical protein